MKLTYMIPQFAYYALGTVIGFVSPSTIRRWIETLPSDSVRWTIADYTPARYGIF